jgi:phosphoglycolate phosphatase
MDRQNKEHLQKVLFKQLDAYLFDLDGTLIDSSKDIAISANYALKSLGFKQLDEDKIIKHVGYGGENLIRNILPVNDEEIIKKAVNIFREYYFANPVKYTKPYKGIPEVLKLLKEKGKKLAVITNKYENISIQILEKLELIDFFDIVIGGDTYENKKPHPEPILKALEKLKTKKSIMIGDSEADINAGKSAGINTALVLYGFGNPDKIKNLYPDIIFEKSDDILEALN